MDEASWLALTATLTALGGAWTVYAWRHRGAASGLRGAGLTLLVPALHLTDTLRLLVDVGAEVAAWATRLVLSPTVWLGIVLGAVGVVLLVASSLLRARELEHGGRGGRERRDATQGGPRARVEPPARGRSHGRATGPTTSGGDDDLDEIEELLRRRGIT